MNSLVLLTAAALVQTGVAAGQSDASVNATDKPAASASLVAAPQASAARPDPSKQEIALPALNGWNATLMYESDVGIWTCGTLDAFDLFGAPDAFGLDDKGRCTLLSVYSGKWTPYQTVDDREWLGSIAHVDLDPRRPGREVYTGGKRGNLFQIAFHRDGTYDTSRIAAFPGEELHTAVAGDLDPSRPGNELLIFTHFGNVYDIRPKGPAIEFEAPRIATISGRVRQALVLPTATGAAATTSPWIAAVCRTGEVLLLRLTANGLESKEILKEEMGFGRLAVKKGGAGDPIVLYVTRDDGVILRLEAAGEKWRREIIYAGPQGPRGIAAGRFDADAAVETVAVFGYSQRVELLSRRPGESWRVETLFEDRDKGHWLATAELDGRNGTDELIGSGYGSRMFLLTRPPGYGLTDTLKNPKPENGEKSTSANSHASDPFASPVTGSGACTNRLSAAKSSSHSEQGGAEGRLVLRFGALELQRR